MNRRPAGAAGSRIALLALFFCAASAPAQRLVSLAPGLTEIVFALGRGDALVGVTKFCDYPPAAGKIAKVGGFLDFSPEALLALAPDVVLAYPEHARRLQSLPAAVRVLTLGHARLADLLASMTEIGRALGRDEEAARLVGSIRRRLRRVAGQVAGRDKVRALFVAGRSPDELRNMFIIGRRDFLNDLLETAGGVNAYQGPIGYPSVSLETVIALAPEFIFEISAHSEGIADEKVFALWRPLAMVPAVANRRVRVIRDPAWLRPGPRVAEVAEELARQLHPARAGAGTRRHHD